MAKQSRFGSPEEARMVPVLDHPRLGIPGSLERAWACPGRAPPCLGELHSTRMPSFSCVGRLSDGSALGRDPDNMDGNSTRIWRYHFPMSQTGAWEIEGDRYTYIGPCGLELELVCRGTSMWLPQHHAYLEASFTLPPREPAPVAPEAHDTTFRRTAEAGPSTRKRTWKDCLDAPAYRRAVRRSMPQGTTGRRTLPDPPSSSSEPMEDESTEIEADADEGLVIELVNIGSSIEVIELSSDSGTEEDPSECSSTPSSAVSSR
ncbi:hypothetical protein Lal_00032018 [Lupinus albus]|nr:hypothetical protein Lal_00032018 [Lupinus albus]